MGRLVEAAHEYSINLNNVMCTHLYNIFNPQAFKNVVGRLLEANNREMWNAPPEVSAYYVVITLSYYMISYYIVLTYYMLEAGGRDKLDRCRLQIQQKLQGLYLDLNSTQ